MKKRLLNGLLAVLLIVSATLALWQVSFNFSFAPGDPDQTFVFFGLSLLIFLLMVTLGFMLVRIVVKMWVERRRAGSRIRTKLVAGALILSLMPVIFMVLFNWEVMNRTLAKWFTGPTEHVTEDVRRIAAALDQQTRGKALAEAELLASMPEAARQIENPAPETPWLDSFCRRRGIAGAQLLPSGSMEPVARFGQFPGRKDQDPPAQTAAAPVMRNGATIGAVFIDEAVPINFARRVRDIEGDVRLFRQLDAQRTATRRSVTELIILIAIFVLFVAGWLAQYLARQISEPISALLRAAEEVSKGNLGYRVNVKAIDELAQLVGGFNRMTADLEANRGELEARRRFTEAILESIPTGIISIDSSGTVRRVNKALDVMLPDVNARAATRLDDLFAREDAVEIRYLMNRARRTGVASQQLDVRPRARRCIWLSRWQPSSAGATSGFVVVIEDTSDLLRAQKTAAWSEVARRVAHEIRNPLTPITLSAERIIRQANRTPLTPAVDQLLRECAEHYPRGNPSVKRLVDEFSQFSRLPTRSPWCAI